MNTLSLHSICTATAECRKGRNEFCGICVWKIIEIYIRKYAAAKLKGRPKIVDSFGMVQEPQTNRGIQVAINVYTNEQPRIAHASILSADLP